MNTWEKENYDWAVDSLRAQHPSVPQARFMMVPLSEFSNEDLQRMVVLGWRNEGKFMEDAARERDLLLGISK